MSSAAVRRRWESQDCAIGAWCQLGSPIVAEILAGLDYDYVCIDMQHGLIGHETMVSMLQACARFDTTVLVRVDANDFAAIGRALDAGADGIIVPMVNSAAEAESAVRSARYFPSGDRSFGPVRSKLTIGSDPETANAAVLLFVMVETPDGLENAAAISAVPGLDGIYVGPTDLSLSMGHSLPGDKQAAAVAAAIDGVRDICTGVGIVPAIHGRGPGDVRQQMEAGFRMVTVGTDAEFIRSAALSSCVGARSLSQGVPHGD